MHHVITKFSMSFLPIIVCFEHANPSISFHLFLPGAVLNSATSGDITQERGQNGLCQANGSQPAVSG